MLQKALLFLWSQAWRELQGDLKTAYSGAGEAHTEARHQGRQRGPSKASGFQMFLVVLEGESFEDTLSSLQR